MSWKAEVFTEGKWYSNGLRFEQREEASQYAIDLFNRWLTPTDKRVVEVQEEEANSWWNQEEYRAEPLPKPEWRK